MTNSPPVLNFCPEIHGIVSISAARNTYLISEFLLCGGPRCMSRRVGRHSSPSDFVNTIVHRAVPSPVILGMWFLPRRAHPSNALRDEPTNSRAECRGDQVLGSLTARVCISLRAFGHLAGIETRREISKLMDNDIRAGL